jgi:hypothetical protein
VSPNTVVVTVGAGAAATGIAYKLVLVQANFAAFFIVRAQKELEMPLFLRING